MAHPLFHAESSARQFGGQASDYIRVHAWFDRSKAIVAHWTHRALYHHTLGIQDVEHALGESLENSDGAVVRINVIAEQHVREDFNGRICTIDDWLAHFHCPCGSPLVRRLPLTCDDHAAISASKYGGAANDYRPIHQYLDRPLLTNPLPAAMLFSHHAQGIFDAEAALGVAVQNHDGRIIPTRFIAEQHVKDDLGFIPSAHDWLRHLHYASWMNVPQHNSLAYKLSNSA